MIPRIGQYLFWVGAAILGLNPATNSAAAWTASHPSNRGLTGTTSNDIHHLMTTTAKVFASGRSQAIRLPKEFRVSGKEVRLTRVAGGILISEGDPWEAFDAGCRELGQEFFDVMDQRDRTTPQTRDFTAGLP